MSYQKLVQDVDSGIQKHVQDEDSQERFKPFPKIKIWTKMTKFNILKMRSKIKLEIFKIR